MGKAGHFVCVSLIGLWTAGFAWAAPDPAPAPSESPPRLPGGIVDPSGRTGFFPNSDGGIDAIELATGKLLWQTIEAQVPILVDGNFLLAQANVKRSNRLRILRLDLKRDGECDSESDQVVFPAWVSTGEAPGRSFTAKWRLDKHYLRLDWQADAFYSGPMRPSREQETAARKHARGIAIIDLRSGQVEVRPAEKIETPPPPPSLPEQLEKQAVRWQGQVGPLWKVLVLEEAEEGQRLLLHSWDPKRKKQPPPKELIRGRRLLVRTTLDEQVLCLREADPEPDGKSAPTANPARDFWWLFSVQTGDLIGRVPDEKGMHSLAVVGSRVFYLTGSLRRPLDRPRVQPRLLKAVDMTTGKKIWERPIAGKLFAPPPF